MTRAYVAYRNSASGKDIVGVAEDGMMAEAICLNAIAAAPDDEFLFLVESYFLCQVYDPDKTQAGSQLVVHFKRVGKTVLRSGDGIEFKEMNPQPPRPE